MGGDKRACEGEIRNGIVGDKEEQDESKAERGSGMTEPGNAEARGGEPEATGQFNQVGKKGREWAGAKSGGGET